MCKIYQITSQILVEKTTWRYHEKLFPIHRIWFGHGKNSQLPNNSRSMRRSKLNIIPTFYSSNTRWWWLEFSVCQDIVVEQQRVAYYIKSTTPNSDVIIILLLHSLTLLLTVCYCCLMLLHGLSAFTLIVLHALSRRPCHIIIITCNNTRRADDQRRAAILWYGELFWFSPIFRRCTGVARRLKGVKEHVFVRERVAMDLNRRFRIKCVLVCDDVLWFFF